MHNTYLFPRFKYYAVIKHNLQVCINTAYVIIKHLYRIIVKSHTAVLGASSVSDLTKNLATHN